MYVHIYFHGTLSPYICLLVPYALYILSLYMKVHTYVSLYICMYKTFQCEAFAGTLCTIHTRVYTHTYTCVCVCVCVCLISLYMKQQGACICMYVHTHTDTHTHTNTHTHTQTHTHTHNIHTHTRGTFDSNYKTFQCEDLAGTRRGLCTKKNRKMNMYCSGI